MLSPIKIVDIELSQPIPTLQGLERYVALKGLVRLKGVPLGYVQAPIESGQCTAQTLSRLIREQQGWNITAQLLKHGLAAPERLEELPFEDLIDLPVAEYQGELPRMTVAVCTRDRPTDLSLCLNALSKLDYPDLEILVVDNAPTSNATQDLVTCQYPQVRYVREPRPGLDWARNRAILEATGEIIAYTDDDVVVDPGWVKALAQVFAEHTEVMAVTGLVVPYELETEAQILFEQQGGFGRGFEQQWYRTADRTPAWGWLGAGQFGTGANMAFRRSLFELIGYFDPALDVGTVTNGCGDLEMYYRVLKEGYTLVYEPRALVRHRHRRDYDALRQQISYNGVALYAYFTCIAQKYPDEIFNVLYISIWWFCRWYLQRLLISWMHPTRFPRDLILAEMYSVFQHFGRYSQACCNAEKIAQAYPLEPTIPQILRQSRSQLAIADRKQTAIRTIDLSQPLHPLTDIASYLKVRIFVVWRDRLLGEIEVENAYHNLSVSQLSHQLAPRFGLQVLAEMHQLSTDQVWSRMNEAVAQRYNPTGQENSVLRPLSSEVSVSVVLATYDRPEDLRNCLRCLTTQRSPRSIEIVVVDNHPVSGLTAPVIAEFPGVVLVSEEKQGLAYARNAGILVSQGDIIIATDDDVTMPPDWIEKLVAPFGRQDVMVVTGNVLPVELESQSQILFETYGGLGRGYQPFEANGAWFEACPHRTVPTWDLGATANAAFRASIFKHPEIGLMNVALGPGTPSGGCGEDTYVFYKVLKAGYTLLYEPSAFVWHRHRRDMAALRRQIYHYSKGHIAYHLTTLLNDGDLRVIPRLLVGLPLFHLSRIYYRLRGWTEYPISLVLVEMMGHLAGPWALWRSLQRVQRIGYSTPGVRQPVMTAEQTLSEDWVSEAKVLSLVGEE